MSEVLHANVFFFITGSAVIVLTALLCVALFHGIKILKSIQRIVARIDQGAEVLSEDMQSIRMHIAGGGVVRKFIHFLFGSPKKDEDEDEMPRSRTREGKRSSLRVKDES